MNSLVTGATGFVGTHLVRKLRARGDQVRCLVRRSSHTSGLTPLGVELVEGDITNYKSVLEAVCGMDRVFHCAAAVGIGTFPNREYFAINADGAVNIVRACLEAGVNNLLHMSTQSVTFDFTERIKASEDNPGYPAQFRDVYSESKAIGERMILQAARDGWIRACAIRPTFIWGPGDRLMLPAIVKMARQNQLFLIGGGRSKISPSHVENVCDCAILAAEHAAASGQAFLVTDDTDVTAGEFTRQIVEAAGLPPPKKSIPYGLAFALATVVEKIHELPIIKKPPSMSRYGVAIMGKNLTFTCEKAKRMLGYRPTISMDEGMQGLSDWIREIGGIDKIGG